jgi:Domain of unknown function (DUF4265)
MESRDNTDYVVEVWFEIEKDSEGYPKSRDFEGLLCKPVDAECSVCIVKSVPFYLRNVAYGDTIRTEDGPDRCLEFHSVMERGGYSVYRVLLHDPARREELVSQLQNFGAVVEQEGNLIALAASSKEKLDQIVDYILEGKAKDWWGAQDGFVFEDTSGKDSDRAD